MPANTGFPRQSLRQQPLRRLAPRFPFAGLIAVIALAVAGGMWFWTAGVVVALLSWQNGLIASGAVIFCAAVLAQLRAFDLGDILEWMMSGLAALLALVMGVLWGFMALFGFDW